MSLTEGACDATAPPDCDGGSLCYEYWCEAEVGCRSRYLCEDEDVCNGAETCDPESGCHPGTPLDCDDDNPCTDDSCDPESGCEHVNNTRRCDDGNACTQPDQCSGGYCVGGPPVECDNNDPCDGAETCHAVKGCQPGTPLNCDDGDPCTDDVCVSGEGCTGQHVCLADFKTAPELPGADDRTFVKNLDLVVGAGSTTFNINVTRYAGPTDQVSHTLVNATELAQEGLLGYYAELSITAFGVNCTGVGACNDLHAVYFNTYPVDVLNETNSHYLQGTGGQCRFS